MVFFILKLILVLGLISSRKKIFQFSAKLMAGIVLVHTFINAVEAFVDCFEVDRKNSGTVHSVLFNCLCRDAPLTAEGDPEERVARFFAKLTETSFNCLLNSPTNRRT